MYLVSLLFKAFKKSNVGTREPVAYMHREILTVDCFGKIMRGDAN